MYYFRPSKQIDPFRECGSHLFGCFAQGLDAYFTGLRFLIADNDGKTRATGVCFFHLRLEVAIAAMQNDPKSPCPQVPHGFPGETIRGLTLMHDVGIGHWTRYIHTAFHHQRQHSFNTHRKTTGGRR